MMWVDRAEHPGKIFRKRQEERRCVHPDHEKEKAGGMLSVGQRLKMFSVLKTAFLLLKSKPLSCLFLSLPVSEAASLGSSIWPPTLDPSALAFERWDNRGVPCI